MDRPQKEIVPLTAAQREIAGSPESIEIANQIAARMSRRFPRAAEEYRSAAMLGLCAAAASYRPDRGEWAAWAARIVTGRVLDWVRDELQLGMGISRDAHKEGLAPKVVQTSVPAGDQGSRQATLADMLASDEMPVGWEIESQDTVEVFSRRMPREHGRVLRAYLLRAEYDGLLKNVAENMGLSESRLSQVITDATTMLREREGITDPGPGLTACAAHPGQSKSAKLMRRKRKRVAAASN